MKLEEGKKNLISAKMISLYFIILPIYNIMKLEIGIKAHFVIPIFYLLLIVMNRKKLEFKYIGFIVLFFLIEIPYSILGYKDYLYNWFGLMYLLFFYSLPWFIIGFSIKDMKGVLEEFKKSALLIVITNILLIVYSYAKECSMLGNMEISYSILPLSIFSFYYFFENKSIKFLLMAILSTLTIVVVGSRGTVLCIMAYLLLYAITNMKKNIILIVILTIMAVGAFYNYDKIIDGTIEMLANYNIYSRTLAKLQKGEIADDTGRGKIKEVAIENLENKPLLGLGLGVERIYINKEINNMNRDMSSCYPHNLIVEILVQYGYIVGGIIITYLSYLLLETIIKGNKVERDFVIIFFSMEIVRLFLSSSYISSPLFFLLLGGCFKIIYKKKGETVNESSIDCTK